MGLLDNAGAAETSSPPPLYPTLPDVNHRILHQFVWVSVVWLVAQSSVHASTDAPWSALKQGGHVFLLRHTETVPGIGDPPGYRLDDCKTQRNLSAAGRAQALAWGKAFADNGVQTSDVFSSVWCRCVDTAVLAFGKADTWPALNSHFDTGSGEIQAEQVRGGITTRMKPGKTLVLVTHQVNITALTGRTPAMGEAVVARVVQSADKSKPPRLDVVGMLKLP